jgi:SAM-dependent methyltransferase
MTDNNWDDCLGEIWNQPAYWNEYYNNQLSNEFFLSDDGSIYRGGCFDELSYVLMKWFALTKTLPISPNDPSPKFLDTGCGFSILPNVLALWGFQVTAIDLCPSVIFLNEIWNPTEYDLAKCIDIAEPENHMRSILIKDPNRALQELLKYKSPGGYVHYLSADWNDQSALRGSFEFIHCRNSLRESTKSYWRKSLARFFDLLAPGGVLMLEIHGRSEICHEVNEILVDVGFHALQDADTGFYELKEDNLDRSPDKKYVFQIWVL